MSGDENPNPPSGEIDVASLTPVVRRLYGIAKGGPDEGDYRRYLLEKYGSGIVFPADEPVDGDQSTD